MMALKKRYPDLKIVPSIGGWTLSDPFFDFTDKANRDTFVASAKEFLQTWKFFDGIDIDWEFPGGGGGNPALGDPVNDGPAYVALMAELRTMLDELEAETGRHYELTSAIGVGWDKLEDVDYGAAIEHMDYIFTMSYDFFGGFSNVLGHHTGLNCAGHWSVEECNETNFEDEAGVLWPDQGPQYTGAHGIELLLAQGVPANKLVLGAAMYGRGWEGVQQSSFAVEGVPLSGTGNGPLLGTAADGVWEPGLIDYKGIVKTMVGAAGTGINGFQVYYDDVAAGAYVWNPTNGKLVTYDSPQSVIAKGHYVRSEGLAGLFSWEIDADNGDILNAMHDGLGSASGIVVTTPPDESACELTYELPAGWSMISLPCEVEDASLANLFPNAISLFEFGVGYQAATSMDVGKGYWINLPQASSSSITGTGPSSLSVDLPAAWSMVGPGQNVVSASSLGDNVISVFGFEAGYFTAATLEPGQGYWTNLSTAGTLDLSGAPDSKQLAGLPKEEMPAHAVLWAESEGRQRMLHLGVEARQVKALPPLPPAGLFDVRVEVRGMGAWQVPRSSERRDYRLQLQGGTMQLGWRIPQQERGLWQLVVNEKVLDLEAEGMLALEAGVDEVFVRQAVGQVLPGVYALGQNFPNPFNPATTIGYSLPQAESVSLKVYDMAGQMVRHLVEGDQVAGSHQIVWDGLDAAGAPTANGVYIYELRAGEFRALRKMLLLK